MAVNKSKHVGACEHGAAPTADSLPRGLVASVREGAGSMDRIQAGMRQLVLGPIAILAAYAPATPAAAQNDETQLPVTVVTATRIPTRLDRLPATTAVIDRQAIEASQAASVIELLRQVPGLHIDLPGGRGGVSSLYMRGGDPNYTLVLIDGVKVNDPTNSRGGSYDFSLLPLDLIERIEVVRGPMSAVYGSDGMAGVVNIVLRQGTATQEASASATLGRFGYGGGSVTMGTPAGAADLSLAASYVDDGEPVEGSRFIGHSLTATLSASPTETNLLKVIVQLSDADRRSFPDDSGGPKFAVIRTRDAREERQFVLGADLTRELLAGWGYKFHVGYYRRDDTFDSPGVAPGVRDPFGIPSNFSDSKFNRVELTGSLNFELMEGLLLTGGVDASYEDGDTTGGLRFDPVVVPTAFGLDRWIAAPFVELQYAPFENFLILTSVRWDMPEDFERRVSARIGAAYTFMPTGTTVRASWGQGFKLPSFFALGHSLVGNPALKPETSSGFEVGLTQTLSDGRGSIGITAFDTRYKNAIDLDEGPPPRLVNRSAVTARGIELQAAWRPNEDLSLDGFATYVRTDIRNTAEQLRNRPKWTAGASLVWKLSPRLQFSLLARYVGEALDSSIPTGDLLLDPYLRLDTALEYRPRPNWLITVAVDNLLDKNYEEVLGFQQRGIRPRIGARVRF